MSTSRFPAMIALSFCLTVISSLPDAYCVWRVFCGELVSTSPETLCVPAVRRALQPRLRGGDALFPSSDLVRMLEREPDIVEPLDEPHAVGARDVEGQLGTAGAADALGLQIDGERR